MSRKLLLLAEIIMLTLAATVPFASADAARRVTRLIGANNARGWIVAGIDQVQSVTTTESGTRIVVMQSGDVWRIPSHVLPPLALTDVVILAKSASEFVLIIGNEACEAVILR